MKNHFTTEEAKKTGDKLGITWKDWCVEQFRMGLDVELEHGKIHKSTNVTKDDPIATGKIALAHLNEFSDYYTRLKILEEEAERFWAARNLKNHPQIIYFIKESRARGFKDVVIEQALLKKNWPSSEIEKAFSYLKTYSHLESPSEQQISLFLDPELMKLLDKRAKKNLLTLPEQIEDILRRSCINMKPGTTSEKLDDQLVGLFSRKNIGKKKKKK